MLEIYFPLCAADPIRWQRRTPDVEHGIWPDVADEYLQQWLQTDTIRLYIPGEWISVWQVELPDVPRKQIPTILPALLEEELNQDIDELHFAPLKIDQQLATVAVIHQQHMRNIAQWLQANGITFSCGQRALPVSTNCVAHWRQIMLCNRTRYRKRVMRFPAA
ncbi:gspL protein [Escherichia coli TA007]|nr:gspL protein [Escherichia coli TA007]